MLSGLDLSLSVVCSPQTDGADPLKLLNQVLSSMMCMLRVAMVPH